YPPLHRSELPGRRRPPPRGPAEHQAQDRDRHLSGYPPPSWPPRPGAADPHERPHAQGPAQGDRRQEEGQEVGAAVARQQKQAGSSQKRVRRRERKNISHGQAHIKASLNNTFITITDRAGNVITWTSGGSV